MKVLETLPIYQKNNLWVVPFMQENQGKKSRGQFVFTHKRKAEKRQRELNMSLLNNVAYVGKNAKKRQTKDDVSDKTTNGLVPSALILDEMQIPKDDEQIFFLNPNEPLPFPKKKRGRPKKAVAGFMEVEGGIKNMKPSPTPPVKRVIKKPRPTGVVKIKEFKTKPLKLPKLKVDRKTVIKPTRRKVVQSRKVAVEPQKFIQRNKKTGKVEAITKKTRIPKPKNLLADYFTEKGSSRFNPTPMAVVKKKVVRRGRPRKKTLWQKLKFWKR